MFTWMNVPNGLRHRQPAQGGGGSGITPIRFNRMSSIM